VRLGRNTREPATEILKTCHIKSMLNRAPLPSASFVEPTYQPSTASWRVKATVNPTDSNVVELIGAA